MTITIMYNCWNTQLYLIITLFYYSTRDFSDGVILSRFLLLFQYRMVMRRVPVKVTIVEL